MTSQKCIPFNFFFFESLESSLMSLLTLQEQEFFSTSCLSQVTPCRSAEIGVVPDSQGCIGWLVTDCSSTDGVLKCSSQRAMKGNSTSSSLHVRVSSGLCSASTFTILTYSLFGLLRQAGWVSQDRGCCAQMTQCT